MPLEPFSKFFPDVAQDELRAFYLGSNAACDDDDIPEGEYAFFEWYCTEPTCDCQRVMFYVVEKTRGIMAAITYAFDPDELDLMDGATNPMLDPARTPGPYSQRILGFFTERGLDDEYIATLKKHYAMVKQAVDASPVAAPKS